ncbi:MAG: 2-C-methyl-D-erythritol 4-phosphate cytidylyltransferase, partial [Bacteroidales bacterium]|nr:2-C-methyl-D-erythritol 4-phosphate cytidylyltransferase [Bacteroidales bacterium]
FQIPLKLVAGGQERFFSVKNALDYIPGDSIVGIHDGVRPFVSNQTLNRLFASLQKNNAVIPAVPPHESVRIEDDAKNTMLDRNKVKLVQTPQCFKSDVIKEAYNTIYKPFFTDDASVVEYALKMPITIVDGNRENIKITTPLDLMMAELIYENFG